MSAVDDPLALPTAADVDEAARRLAGIALHTPLLTSAALDAMTGGHIFLKAETLQRTGSFKFRGAYNKLASIPTDQRAGGVVAYSSGNHAQGVAAAAQLLGMPCVIVMPRDAPRAKRERTAAFGAEIVLYDRVREDRETIAADIAARRGAVLVPPYDDALIIAGQGTAGREIVDDLGAIGLVPEIVVVTASGGGLTAGIGGQVVAGDDRPPIAARYVVKQPFKFMNVVFDGLPEVRIGTVFAAYFFERALPLRGVEALSESAALAAFIALPQVGGGIVVDHARDVDRQRVKRTEAVLC